MPEVMAPENHQHGTQQVHTSQVTGPGQGKTRSVKVGFTLRNKRVVGEAFDSTAKTELPLSRIRAGES